MRPVIIIDRVLRSAYIAGSCGEVSLIRRSLESPADLGPCAVVPGLSFTLS